MGFHRKHNILRENNSGRLKGISEVVSTMLMVMVTVMLVFLANTMFTELAQNAGSSTDKVLQGNQKMSQKVILPTAYCCGSAICFQMMASGTNEFPIPTQGASYFVNNVPRQIIFWDVGSLGPSCQDNPELAPGESCFAKIMDACTGDDIVRVLLPWGMQAYRTVSI